MPEYKVAGLSNASFFRLNGGVVDPTSEQPLIVDQLLEFVFPSAPNLEKRQREIVYDRAHGVDQTALTWATVRTGEFKFLRNLVFGPPRANVRIAPTPKNLATLSKSQQFQAQRRLARIWYKRMRSSYAVKQYENYIEFDAEIITKDVVNATYQALQTTILTGVPK